MTALGLLPNPTEIEKLLPFCTQEERAELERLLGAHGRFKLWAPINGPQSMAYYSRADITGYGGAAGGGKTDLIAGLALLDHERTLVVRREKAQTEGFVQRVMEIMGGTQGYNSQKGFWRLPGGRLLELAGLDNPGDERRWQGRPHDLKAFDEVTEQREKQVRFVMGWNRTSNPDLHPRVLFTFNPPTTTEGRWVIDFFGPWLNPTHPLYPTPPGELRYAAMLPGADGEWRDVWVESGEPFVLVDGEQVYDFDEAHFKPEEIIRPKSRTFIPARVTDNPYYMASGYMSTLQSLPEPLRSQMLYGDFQAGIEEDVWQVIPTSWFDAATARWKPLDVKPPMDSMGVDVARGGKDNTIVARRHGMWFDKPEHKTGRETPDGPTGAAFAIAHARDNTPIHVDVIGVGSSVYDFLVAANQSAYGINVSEKATRRDKSGKLEFYNLRSQLWWMMREALDPHANNGIALPPDSRLKADLTAAKWTLKGGKIYVQSREEIEEAIGRSPDWASAYILALIDTPKLSTVYGGVKSARATYNPYA